ncbi:hypothetical protein H632_c998p0 [Helicosporidium sp. ATCC 50920]|nr:hypothetical protein H632_c998p0 [Helicosporidium sp. ATCC 50920]|eukprot:KDD74904.1 hypothetical protein H632_c998p0 [Helicosporidium sp. ATCC 50920]
MQAEEFVEAYDSQVNSMQAFTRVFREEAESWVVEVMHGMVANLQRAAQEADASQLKAGKRGGKLGDCADQLRKGFAVSLQASGNPDKKLAALNIVNISIKIYFQLNTLRLCKNLIRTVESRQFLPFEQFPAAQRVTYKFYVGRLAVFDEDYKEAQDALEYALRRCHVSAARNRARILKYLLPVRMLLGVLPSPALMHKYQLEQYQPIAQAVRHGDLQLFDDTMELQQLRFIREGTYLLLEKLRLAVCRRLLRAVHAVHGRDEPAKAAQIPLAWFQAALAVQARRRKGDLGVEMDMDEIECVCANLIYRKYIKGYISHKNKVMVVAKSDPFPPLSSVTLRDA